MRGQGNLPDITLTEEKQQYHQQNTPQKVEQNHSGAVKTSEQNDENDACRDLRPVVKDERNIA